jgi:hypothetical protein
MRMKKVILREILSVACPGMITRDRLVGSRPVASTARRLGAVSMIDPRRGIGGRHGRP